MLINSIIIKLTRRGAGVSPDYTLTVYGNGTLIYEGRENVKVKGNIEEFISEGKIMALLSEFKESDFFSLKDNYAITESSGRPYSIISISMPGEKQEIMTKSITHYHGDRNVPEQLKRLENKIDEITGSEKWVGNTIDFNAFQSKNQLREEPKPPVDKIPDGPYQPTRKKPIKLIAVLVSVILIVAILFLAFNLGFFDSPSESYTTPNIVVYTASNIGGFDIYDIAENFEQNDTVYLYFECENMSTLSNGTGCNINIDVVVSIDDFVAHEFSFVKTSVEDYYEYSFETNESWPVGDYTIELTLTDKVSNKQVVNLTYFGLYEKLEISVLDPASSITGFRDYDLYYSFNPGNKIYIYQEYGGFAITENNECDLYFEISIRTNEEIVYTNYSTEEKPANTAHAWWLTTDESWSKGLYFVTIDMTDNIYLRTASKTTTFTIV